MVAFLQQSAYGIVRSNPKYGSAEYTCGLQFHQLWMITRKEDPPSSCNCNSIAATTLPALQIFLDLTVDDLFNWQVSTCTLFFFFCKEGGLALLHLFIFLFSYFTYMYM